jgi:hypothetical protein
MYTKLYECENHKICAGLTILWVKAMLDKKEPKDTKPDPIKGEQAQNQYADPKYNPKDDPKHEFRGLNCLFLPNQLLPSAHVNGTAHLLSGCILDHPGVYYIHHEREELLCRGGGTYAHALGAANIRDKSKFYFFDANEGLFECDNSDLIGRFLHLYQSDNYKEMWRMDKR